MHLKKLLVAGMAAVALAAVGCGPPAPTERILAVAYTNLDGVKGFDPNGLDVLIAKLVDTNNDGVPSVGDTVTLGRYPMAFNAPLFGTFQFPGPYVVDGMYEAATSKRIVVRHAAAVFGFSSDGGGQVWGAIDHFGDPYWMFAETETDDIVAALQGSPGAPDSPTPLEMRPANGLDDSFVDVDVFNPLP